MTFMDKDMLDALRTHYDTTDLSDSIASAAPEHDTIETDEIMVSTSIRLPRSLMTRVRERAAEVGIPATTLIREWVMDRLEAGEEQAVISVADLQRFIAERSHPAA